MKGLRKRLYRCFLIHFVIMANGSRGQIELSHWLLSLDFTVWTVTTESFHFKYYFLRQEKSSHERQIIIESGKFHLSWNFFFTRKQKKFTLKEHLIYGVNFNTQTNNICDFKDTKWCLVKHNCKLGRKESEVHFTERHDT